ncbi:hypothetical protein PV326_008623 [Microctonus aethiopoides]|nr:hypothetical protein PV326_008623 [Microctonus aethiopoides]
MYYLKGRTLLTIFFMIVLTLLAIIYHILNISDDNNDVSSRKAYLHMKAENSYLISESTYDTINTERRQQLEGKVFGQLKNADRQHEYNDKYGYNNVLNSDASIFKGHKIVHIDLKGAPPIIDYYKYLLKLLKQLGATGILIEYEDMFPYKDKIVNISAGNCYSNNDIITIQNLAKDNDLIVIPLIQTFGHLEFVLKLNEYKNYREVERYPQVICPTYNGTLTFIYDMIDQIVAAHPNIKHLHIGADEVYYIGECSRCLDEMAKRQWDKKQLFLNHVVKIARYIKSRYSHLTILMWDDEFRNILPQEIIESGLHKLIQPVIWKYTTNPGNSLTEQLWNSYANIWHSVWIATAFKGATFPDRYYTNISYHIENHQRWLEMIDKYSDKIHFKGVFLTGWQRYDHFSVLCELLAVSLPSLAINLAIMQSNNLNSFPSELPRYIADILQCDGTVSLTIPEPHHGWTKCGYHGVAVYSVIVRLFFLNDEINRMEQHNTFIGWMKPYNIKYAYSNPGHVEEAVGELDRFKMELIYIEKEMRTAMNGIYDDYTLTEWIETFVVPLNDKVNQLWEAKEKILSKNSWPRRPFNKIDS